MGHVEEFKEQPITVRLVSDGELSDPVFLADVKTFASRLRVPRRQFVDWLVDGVRDSETCLIDSAGDPVTIEFEEIEKDNIDLWVRDWVRMPERHVAPRLRAESRERVRLVATMLRMIFPKESSVWGTGSLMC